MKIEIELDDLSTSTIQDIIDAMEPDRAEAQQDLSSAGTDTQRCMNILASKLLPENEYDEAEKDALDAVEVERQYRVVYDRIADPMRVMQRIIAERNGELE